MKRVTVVMVVYETPESLLLESLTSLLNSSYSPSEIILVNNSNREIPKIIANLKDIRVRVINNKVNNGYVAGANQGAQRAEGDFTLFVNDDAVLDSNVIGNLLSAFEDPKVGLAGPVIYFKSPKGKIWFSGGKIYPWLGNCREMREPLDKITEFDWVSGCVLMVKKDVFEKAGFFDEGYFMYYDDADYSIRVRYLGYKVVVVPTAIVWHGRYDLQKRSSGWRLNYVFRSKFRFIWKNLPGYQAIVSTIFQLTAVSLYDFIFWRQTPLIKFRIFTNFLLMSIREKKMD